jgi:hypothetical protein
MANPDFEYPLDHFEFYVVRASRHEPVEVHLRGQFDEKPIPTKVYDRRLFAPATDKNAEGLRDKDAHLTWYTIESGAREPYRTVVVDNQFGTQKYRIGPPRALLVPAQKERHEPPGRLDHFKVYPVVFGEFEPREVRLLNQFEREHHSVEVERPYGFAVPVEKRGERHHAEIVNPDAHLMLYRITPHPSERESSARDQFGEYKMRIYRSVLLAVPTKKLEWGE